MLDVLSRNYNNRNPKAAMFEIAVSFKPRGTEELPEEPKTEKLKRDLLEEWDIRVPDLEADEEGTGGEPMGREQPDSDQPGQEASDCGNSDNDTIVFEADDYMVAISLMPAPVPAGEAEYYAKSNYFWKGAVDAASEHRAHILVAVIGGRERDPFEAGKLYVKISSACLKQENALGIYTSGTVFEPEMYCAVAEEMKEEEETYPILDWIYIGLYQTEKGMNGYTYGMTAFGKDEIEVVESAAAPAELHEFLFDIASYVLYDDVLLQDGETIGFTEDEKLPITKSEGEAVEGESLKIAFMPAQ